MSINTDTTGRQELWGEAFTACLQNPIIGHGAAADKLTSIERFHNAYLQEWYNGGLISLIFFTGTFAFALFKTFNLTRLRNLDPESLQIGRLLFCWTIVLTSSAFFEGKLASPSNLLIFTFILVSIMASRLEQNNLLLAQHQDF